jgi:biotin transport system substrate-specific component
MHSSQVKMMVSASMFAALISAGAYLAVPIGPVPIVLQNLFVMLAGVVLGSRWGLASVSIYLLAGVCGLPVFAGGVGGIGRLLGPTGGYLIGYLPAAFLIGSVIERFGSRVSVQIVAMICGALAVYACGVTWLNLVTTMGWSRSLAFGMFPFLVGDAIKIAAAVPIARAVRPIIRPSVKDPVV